MDARFYDCFIFDQLRKLAIEVQLVSDVENLKKIFTECEPVLRTLDLGLRKKYLDILSDLLSEFNSPVLQKLVPIASCLENDFTFSRLRGCIVERIGIGFPVHRLHYLRHHHSSRWDILWDGIDSALSSTTVFPSLNEAAAFEIPNNPLNNRVSMIPDVHDLLPRTAFRGVLLSQSKYHGYARRPRELAGKLAARISASFFTAESPRRDEGSENEMKETKHAPLTYRVKPAETPDDLKRCMDIRKAVFIDEQGYDISIETNESTHFLMTLPDTGEPVGTVRVINTSGQVYQNVAQIGRVAILKPYRGRGWGRPLIETVHEYVRSIGGTEVWCQSQASDPSKGGVDATAFYKRLGYVERGSRYIKEGTEHQDMVLSLI
ncbi:acyl-CoA N-acyltransferase [Punctularia strigosozonata HHB-11173 SS5]|uniref:Acyl-CoA N-acyltransferase n=1 Tax=Punctularia strigosozonata (strain HHB-11173) TaxID=741275 RepID=R7S385_PUNST|nr:acyl-CoA N-acyltransferase [Punctularia strigosozonata HHB-11173 SS5]EIN04865.1 acyl-CoA N-acyltransferase [Punctularia strigosozonata HHB-11173 SS5]